MGVERRGEGRRGGKGREGRGRGLVGKRGRGGKITASYKTDANGVLSTERSCKQFGTVKVTAGKKNHTQQKYTKRCEKLIHQ